MVLFEVNLAPREKKPVKRNIYIRKRANTTRINKELQEFATDFEVGKNESVDAKWNIPAYRTCTSCHNLPWFLRSLRRQTKKKQRLYNRAKKSERQSDWNEFKLARKQLHIPRTLIGPETVIFLTFSTTP